MDIGSIIASAIGTAPLIVTATAYITSRLSGLSVRIESMEKQLDKLDASRETIALIPSLVDRIRNLEKAVFSKVFGTEHE